MPVSISSGYNPPFPAAVVQDDEDASLNEKNLPQRLLTLVRLVEKNESTYEKNMEELVELMNSFIALYSRRGLLQGNESKAGRILSSTTQGKKSGSSDRKNASKKNNDLQINPPEDGEGHSEVPLSEGLIFTALARIFADSKESVNHIIDCDWAILIALAAELCVAMSQHVQTRKDDGNACSMAEYELLAQSGKSILSGLALKIHFLELEMRKHSSQMGGLAASRLEKCLAMSIFLDEDKHVAPILSCLRAACSFVTMFGTKLSRSTALLSDLKCIGWQFISCPEESLQDAAARLLAALPLAGGTDRKTTSELWNVGMTNFVAMFNRLIETVAPVVKTHGKEEITLSEDAEVVLQRWISFLRQDISGDHDRVSTFRSLLRGLAISMQHFLYRDCYGHTSGVFLEALIDIEGILELVERFLSYPMSAESLYFRTKKRLRDETVDGGLISARIIALEVANEMKRLGHDILDCLISSVGGQALLPFARRIIRMSYASLLTTCSGPVRKAMDPASSVQFEGKKRRWLHLSIPLRTKAVRTIQLVAVAFGSDRTAKVDSSDRSADSKSDGELAITLAAGCLIEQIGATDIDQSVEETWGGLDEKVDLINACLDCLRGALSSSNGFLGFATRAVIDSMVLTCLLRPTDSSPGNPFGWSSVQCRIFQLASTCVATPWNDGSSTSILSSLKRSAIKACIESDEAVSLAAKEALRVCDLYGIPRAPPLVFVHRTLGEGSLRMEQMAPKIIEDIQNAKVEASRARQAVDEAAETKVREKRQRELERKESNKRKRDAKEMIKNEMQEITSNVVDLGTEKETTQVDSQQERQDAQELYTDVDDGMDGNEEKEDERRNEPQGKFEGVASSDEADDKDDDDFPDIDIVADGPDSDDD